MARVSSQPAQPADPTAISLTRLLDRLEHTLLSPDADPKLRTSSYERTKVGANLEYARTLLLRLEHDAASIKIQSRKQALSADLQSKRDLIKQLNQRLYELNQLDDSEIEESSSEDEDEAVPSYAPAHRNTSDTIDTEHRQGNQALNDAAGNLASTLRSRRPHAQEGSDEARGETTGSSLFSRSGNPNADPKLQQHEKTMSHNRTEQENLTSSLLQMAQALKHSSMQFGSSLEAEKDVLSRAGKGLDKNAEGMQAAGQRMGTLRRMTEGKGWWGRVMMYGYIALLWVAVLVIMFVLPKLRF